MITHNEFSKKFSNAWNGTCFSRFSCIGSFGTCPSKFTRNVRDRPEHLGKLGTVNNSEPYYPPLNETGPETIQSFESIEGSNADILGNDTNISDTNNTLMDSITVNEQEDCMQLPNQSAVDCP